MVTPRALVLVNPHCGGDLPEGWPQLLAGAGVAPRIEWPESPEAMGRLIADCARQRDADRIAVAGGDGTLHRALPALLEARMPVALIPVGTANDLARTLGLPTDPVAVFDVVARGVPQRIDVGLANGVPFLNAVSLGVGVHVNRELDPATKSLWGSLSYLRAAWRAIEKERPFELDIRWNGSQDQVRCVHATVGNGVFHGGGVRVAEDASITDGKLDLYTLPPRGALGLAALVPWLRLGSQRRLEGVRSLRAGCLRLHTSRPLEVYADGEHVTRTPLELSVLPGALEVLVPTGGEAAAGTSLLRDEREVALNELLAGCRALAESYAALRDSLEPDDPGAADFFASLAAARERAAQRLEGHVRRLGELPAAPDPDRGLLERLTARAKGALAGDRTRALAEDRAAAERDLLAAAEAARKQALQPDTLALVQEIEEESERDRQRLEALAAEHRG